MRTAGLSGGTHVRGRPGIVPPSLAVELPRPEIDARLEDAKALPLTIVSAGPGWGKTTAVAGWARRRLERAVWLTADDSLDDAAAFWAAALHALAGAGVVGPDDPLASLSTAAGLTDEVTEALYKGLAEHRDAVLVVDDFHAIDDADLLRQLSEFALADVGIRLVLLTRSDPPMPLHRLRLEGKLAELASKDLGFDRATVGLLAAALEDAPLDDVAVDVIHARTEGWPAGVRLAMLHASRTRDHAVGFGGADRSVSEYLAAEVLDRYPPDMREFLMRISVVEAVDADLAEALAPGAGGLARLEDLERANHFVSTLDAERTVFRCHPLLREFLMNALLSRDREGLRRAHLAAAQELSRRGDAVRALRHGVAAEDWDLVPELFFRASGALVGSERAILRDLLERVPYGSIPRTPGLELCAAGAELVAGHLYAVAEHLRAAAALPGFDDLPPMGIALARNLAAGIARTEGDLPAVVAQSAAALQVMSRVDPSPGVTALRAIAARQHAIGLTWLGQYATARAAFEAVDDEGLVEVSLSRLGARGYAAWCDAMSGELGTAAAAARSAVEDAARSGWSSLLQARPSYLTLALVHVLQGEPAGAEGDVARGLAAEVGGIELWPTVALRAVQAAAAVSQDRPRAAARAWQLAQAGERQWAAAAGLRDLMTRTGTDVGLLVGGPWLSAALTADGNDGDVSATAWSCAARVALARGDAATAADLASRVAGASTADLMDVIARIEAALVLAVLAHQKGRPLAASRYVGAALSLARPERLVRPILVTSPLALPLVRAMLLAEPPSDPLTRELVTALDVRVPERIEPEFLAEPLTARELTVLAELATMKSNAEIAADCYVSPNTVKSHVKSILRKLGVGSRREAVRRGRELGLLE